MSKPQVNGAGASVLFELEAGVARITLNRPQRLNALDGDTIHALAATLQNACDDERTRVILIGGQGRAFCAGGDIDTFNDDIHTLPERLRTLLIPLNAALLKTVASGLPIVAAVNGPVGGGGIGLALCADYVLAARSMRLRCGYSAIGLSPDAGSAYFLAQRAGPVRARQLLFLNQALDVQACHQYGIVDEVYPDDELSDAAQALARRLSAGPKQVHARIKSLLGPFGTRPLAEHLQAELEAIAASAAHEDAREGIRAFLEKRPPQFSGAP